MLCFGARYVWYWFVPCFSIASVSCFDWLILFWFSRQFGETLLEFRCWFDLKAIKGKVFSAKHYFIRESIEAQIQLKLILQFAIFWMRHFKIPGGSSKHKARQSRSNTTSSLSFLLLQTLNLNSWECLGQLWRMHHDELVQFSKLFQNFGLASLELVGWVSWKPAVGAVALPLLNHNRISVEDQLFHCIGKRK